MKKIILTLLIAMIIIFAMSMAVFAADTSGTSGPLNEYLTWQFLGTMAGAVFLTTTITEFFKFPLDKVWKIPTRYLVYLIAAVILFAVEIFTGTLTIDRAVLILFNAILVTMASMGAYEATIKKLESKGSG